ncbi:MAG: hypothetical protein IPK60_10945 [Sandaracinaceae bacterium]|nr:hypothetical protein [Sandaracinaceae bacterium]
MSAKASITKASRATGPATDRKKLMTELGEATYAMLSEGTLPTPTRLRPLMERLISSTEDQKTQKKSGPTKGKKTARN